KHSVINSVVLGSHSAVSVPFCSPIAGGGEFTHSGQPSISWAFLRRRGNRLEQDHESGELIQRADGEERLPNIERRTFIGSVAGGIALLGGIAQAPHGPNPARAQGTAEAAWPNRPVRFIVPPAPGGGLDFVARVVGEPVSRAMGQQVVIENRTGAGGTIGIETVIKSPPDGYSVLVTNDNVASAPHILKLGVDYLKELVPVIQLARQ